MKRAPEKLSFCFKCPDTGTVWILGNILYLFKYCELPLDHRLFISLLPCTGSKQVYKQVLKEPFFNCFNLEKKMVDSVYQASLFIENSIFSCSVAVYVMYLKEPFA